MTLPLWLIAAHFFLDWFCQNDWMALNKSKRWDVLAVHVAVVSVPLLVLGWRFAAITFVAHFITDAITARWTSKLWFIDFYPRPDSERDSTGFFRYGAYPFYARIVPGRRHWFFVVIGLDQLLHYVQYAVTWKVLFG